jgi:phosphoribosylglycinamide formyltransferase-1|tara:strand:+ start:448 stop:1074 length:627 start_codon:yes stop_codon:yes gene_type:complete
MTLKIGILVSGRGTNLEAIIESYKNNELGEVEISVVISNKLNTAAIEKAKEHNIDTLIIEQKKNNNSKYDEILYKSLVNKGVTKENGLVVLAGFMKILSPWFIEQFKNRIINIHPSILPSFTGLEAQKQAIEYGVKVSGCTVHFVTADVDSGPIILQESVKIKEGDTIETLSEKILIEEHKIYSKAIMLFAKKKLRVKGKKVMIIDNN